MSDRISWWPTLWLRRNKTSLTLTGPSTFYFSFFNCLFQNASIIEQFHCSHVESLVSREHCRKLEKYPGNGKFLRKVDETFCRRRPRTTFSSEQTEQLEKVSACPDSVESAYFSKAAYVLMYVAFWDIAWALDLDNSSRSIFARNTSTVSTFHVRDGRALLKSCS